MKKRPARRRNTTRPVSKTKQAIDTLKAAIQSDTDYAWTWHCNIAMAFHDAGGTHEEGNRGAARFMQSIFDVDVTKFDQWNSFAWASGAERPSLREDVRFLALLERMEAMAENISDSVDVTHGVIDTLSKLIKDKTPPPEPRLGVMPRPIWLDKRRNDLCAAIGRCGGGGMQAPIAWLTELFDLEKEISKP